MTTLEEILLESGDEIKCPECGGNILLWKGCSHSPKMEICANGRCGYKKVYEGVSASGLGFLTPEKCLKCGEYIYKVMYAGIETKYCNCKKE
jgi:hypothetical protein